MTASSIILPSGEELTTEEVLTGLLLLARAEAAFPLMGEHDTLAALLSLIPLVLEFNNEHEII